MLFNKIFEHTSYQIQCHIGINTAQYVNMLYDRPNATRSRNIKSWLQKLYSRNHDLFHQCDSVGCRRLQCKHYDMFFPSTLGNKDIMGHDIHVFTFPKNLEKSWLSEGLRCPN